ncbi:hypothetical protein DEDE109153_01035 [Deinococcus deserti]|uniref:Uncharacterized protein n=1 Tax=Deinococcus deserti (strain DSM 17065 / CIP 109153 / LMG 22923 / VCD115) TaxID=546414 RepID=C1CVM9_DEIDV|nr:Hypothetical protein Deide_13101 [Deinococcus deserti VCD115]
MTPAPSLNTLTPSKWARVVSGVTWAEYAVNWTGKVEAKRTRGPLIVWATKTGEGEDLPCMEVPSPSPLEVEAARLNMRPHFLAFVRCAQGRRKTKIGRRIGFLTLWRGASREGRQEAKREYLSDLSYAALMACRKQEGRKGLTGLMAPKTQRARKEATLDIASERFHDRLRGFAPAYWESSADGTDTRSLEAARNHYEEVKKIVEMGAEIREFGTHFIGFGEADVVAEFGNALAYALLIKDKRTVSLIYANLNARRLWRCRLHEAVALRDLKAAAFRAHVTRRVRPPARRTRAPRPLYAKPRPPTCPCAPPVTCLPGC